MGLLPFAQAPTSQAANDTKLGRLNIQPSRKGYGAAGVKWCEDLCYGFWRREIRTKQKAATRWGVAADV